MTTAVIDREEITDRLPGRSDREPKREWRALVVLGILILASVAGMGVLFYKLEHPVPAEIFQGR